MNAVILLALSWAVHGWSGYRPLAKVAAENVDGREVRHISNVQGSSGACIYTVPREASRAGDVVRAVFEAKGSGSGFATVARYTGETLFNQTSRLEKFRLTDEWKRYEFYFPVGDGSAGKTAFGNGTNWRRCSVRYNAGNYRCCRLVPDYRTE